MTDDERSRASERARDLRGELASHGADPGTKLEKAKRAGVPLLDEQAFLALLAPPQP